MNKLVLSTMVLALVCTACSRSTSEVYCEEFGACVDDINGGVGVPDAAIDECVDDVDATLEQLSDAEREQIEDTIDRCGDEEGCDFVVCICELVQFDDDLCAAARQAQ